MLNIKEVVINLVTTSLKNIVNTPLCINNRIIKKELAKLKNISIISDYGVIIIYIVIKI